LTGGLLLGFATPPALLPFGEWLVLPALAIWFGVAVDGRRPGLHSYLFGCAHMAWFSWSVRHVMLPAYLAIVFVGGLYYLLATKCVRSAPRRLRGAGFGVAVAGAFWLRAVMPDIHYPHGQPCHCLYEWPTLMRAAVVGGEPLFNASLAWIAAAGYGMWASWRTAQPSWRSASARFVGATGLLVALAVLGNVVSSAAMPPPELDDRARTLRVTAIEPGFHPDEIRAVPPSQRGAWSERMLEQRLLEPTRLALRADPAPDLVLWPESSVGRALSVDRIDRGRASLLTGRLPAVTAQLVVGANVIRERRLTPSALQLELPSGRVLGHHDKQRLVPGGEFLPWIHWLPEAWSAWLKGQFAAAMGSLPDCAPGQERPPMLTPSGAPFGALLCYDNAFPGPAAGQVEQGAELLVVLSNEAWYRGGGELSQLEAMTVVRACENVVPIVRCTMDGRSVWVDASGVIRGALPLAAAPQAEARTLSVSLQRGAGKPPALSWLRRLSGPACGLATAIMALLMLVGLRR